MSLLKKIFGQKALSPDDQIGERIKSMVEICMEYVGFDNPEIDNVYIFTTIEESQYVNYCFRINGEIIKKHKVNESLTSSVNVESERQRQVLEICNEEVKNIKEIFRKEGREMFKHFKILYDNKTNKMDSSFEYNILLTGTDLTPHDIEADWIETIK